MVLTPIALAQQGQPPNITILIVMTSAFVISILVLVAALKMKRLQAYWLAVAASIMAIIISPANLIGLPIGIWALVVLSQREVRAAFARESATGSASASPPDDAASTSTPPQALAEPVAHRAVADNAAVEQALQQVQGPAIGLLVVGILHALAMPLFSFVLVWSVRFGAEVWLPLMVIPTLIFGLVVSSVTIVAAPEDEAA